MVLSETPIAAAMAGCLIPLSRSNIIWMRSRCAPGSFHRSAVFNSRICRFVHLTICFSESDGKGNHTNTPSTWHQATVNPSIQSAMEPV
jgi:hypothetical protein